MKLNFLITLTDQKFRGDWRLYKEIVHLNTTVLILKWWVLPPVVSLDLIKKKAKKERQRDRTYYHCSYMNT